MAREVITKALRPTKKAEKCIVALWLGETLSWKLLNLFP